MMLLELASPGPLVSFKSGMIQMKKMCTISGVTAATSADDIDASPDEEDK